jgi:hypothetical protein
MRNIYDPPLLKQALSGALENLLYLPVFKQLEGRFSGAPLDDPD